MKEVTWTDPTTTPLEDLEAFRERIKHPVCEMCGRKPASGRINITMFLSWISIEICEDCKAKQETTEE